MILAPSNTILTRAQAGYLVSNQAFGTWNGTATSANLVYALGVVPHTARAVNIYRTDWQGNQLLYPTARTNGVEYSLSLTNAYWSPINCTIAAGTIMPDGVNALAVVTANSSGNRCTAPPGTVSVVAGNRYTISYIVAPGSAGFAGLLYTDQVVAAGAIYNLSGSGSVVSTTGNGSGSAAIQELPATGQYLISLSITSGGSTSGGNPGVGIGVSDGSTYSYSVLPSASSGSINAGFAQIEEGNVATSRINTTGSPLTLTDYTLTGTTVNLAQAPASTAVTNATFYAT